MPKKLNIDDIRIYIKEKSNGDCELISKEYLNNRSILTLKCKCGNLFNTTFNKLKNSMMICKKCRNTFLSEKYRLDFNFVKEYIKSKNCEYISGEYINVNSKLLLRCKCGKNFMKDFAHFRKGQNICPSCSKLNIINSKTKYRKEEAEKILSNKGIKLIGDYINSYNYIKCECSKGHQFTTKLQFALYNKFICLQCSKDYHKGENASNYNGGESEVLDRFRKILKNWKMQIAKKYNYKCFITNAKNDCVVHHLVPFMQIVKEACNELKLPLYKKIQDYKKEELQELEELILQKHTLEIGVLIQRKIHFKFHSIYGKIDNTKEQFIEFVKTFKHTN